MGYSRRLTRQELATARSAGLEGLLRGALIDLGLDGSEVSCRLGTPDEVRHLNSRYAGVDATTDVLAFPAVANDHDSGFQMPLEDHGLLGDVIISVATAVSQAGSSGEERAAEVRLLAVHGLLHLLGHDHDRVETARRMTAATRQLLARAASRQGALPPTVPPLRPLE